MSALFRYRVVVARLLRTAPCAARTRPRLGLTWAADVCRRGLSLQLSWYLSTRLGPSLRGYEPVTRRKFERYFSSAVSTPRNRQIFASNILATYNQYGLDGIDIDWEYPGQPGNDGNVVSPSDTANYLAFLQVLRQTLPTTAKITAAAMTVPWADSQGKPMKDMSGFGQVLDWILIMNYDTWGCTCRAPL